MGGGCDDSVFLALNSDTSDMSSGCVGNWMLDKDAFEGKIRGVEEPDEVGKRGGGIA